MVVLSSLIGTVFLDMCLSFNYFGSGFVFRGFSARSDLKMTLNINTKNSRTTVELNHQQLLETSLESSLKPNGSANEVYNPVEPMFSRSYDPLEMPTQVSACYY